MQYWNPQFNLATLTTATTTRPVRVIATETKTNDKGETFVVVKFRDLSDSQEKTEKILPEQLKIFWKKEKKLVDFIAKIRYTFLVMNTTTLTPAYFSAVFSKLSNTLKKGTKTNYGIFSHWDSNNFAIFESGWVGYEALHFIEIQDEEAQKKASEKLNRMLRANGLRVA